MTGIIDVGGANKAAFADGVLDTLQDEKVYADLCIGVSAGAANLVSYVSGQRGRNLNFYTKYNLSSRSIGALAWICSGGSFIDLDYIYGTLSKRNGKCPLDYEAFAASAQQFLAVSTDADTGESVYFDKSCIHQDDYAVISASSCFPGVCKPYRYNGRRYFDGYVSDPIPVQKALDCGCDRILVLLTSPKDRFLDDRNDKAQAEKLKKYPATAERLANYSKRYNQELQLARDLEAEGRALILHPVKVRLSSLEKDKSKILALYHEGLEEGRRAAEFLRARP